MALSRALKELFEKLTGGAVDPSRRKFLKDAGVAGAGAALTPWEKVLKLGDEAPDPDWLLKDIADTEWSASMYDPRIHTAIDDAASERLAERFGFSGGPPLYHDPVKDVSFLELPPPKGDIQDYLKKTISDPDSEWGYDIADSDLLKAVHPDMEPDIDKFWMKYGEDLPQWRKDDIMKQPEFEDYRIHADDYSEIPDAKNIFNSIIGAGIVGGAALGSDEADAMFIGKAAKTFSKDAMKMAEHLENLGATPKQIWGKTYDEYGSPMMRGVDNLWRQEISDTRALRVLGNSEFSVGTGHQNYGLDNYLSHPELEKAYPQLFERGRHGTPNYSVNEFNDLEALGSYVDKSGPGDTGTIELRSNRFPAEIESTALHEVQHGIQSIEGFAAGGQPKNFQPDYDEILADVGRIDARIEDAKHGWKKAKNRDDDLAQSDWLRRYRMAKKEREWMKPAIDDTPFKQYKRLAGEEEARLVQDRQHLTMEQRREYPPFEDIGGGFSFDTPLEDHIVKDKHGRDLAAGTGAIGAMTADELKEQATNDLYYTMDGAPQLRSSGFPMVNKAGSILKKLEGVPGMLVEGSADYLENFGYDDPPWERYKRAFWATVDWL